MSVDKNTKFNGDSDFIKINSEYSQKYNNVIVKENDILIGAAATNGNLPCKIIPKKWDGYHYNSAIMKLYNFKYEII